MSNVTPPALPASPQGPMSVGKAAASVDHVLPTAICWIGRLAAFMTGSNGGFRSLTGGLFASCLLAWWATIATYSFVDWKAAPPPPLTALRLAVVQSFKDAVANDATVSITHTAFAGSVMSDTLRFVDRATNKGPIELHLDEAAARAILRGWLTITLSDGSIESTPMITFYSEEQNDLDKFLHTHTVTLPGSVHAFERASLAFGERLKQLQRARDAGYTKQYGDAVHELTTNLIKKHLGSLGQATSIRRQINGYIQASTLLLFYVLMIQLFARFCLNYMLERQVRKRLSWIWSTDTKFTEDGSSPVELAKNRAILASTAQELDLVPRTRVWQWVGGSHFRSVYLEMFGSAARAFVVEGDYKAVPSFLDSSRNAQSERMAASQNLVRFLLWSLPTVGFIGTVVGIGQALLTTVDVDSVDKAIAAIAKSNVSSSIGVSFDTTLVALLLAFVGMLTFHIFSQLEETELGRAHAEVVAPLMTASNAASAPALVLNLTGELRALEKFRRDWNAVQKELLQRRTSKVGVAMVLLALAVLLLAAERVLSKWYPFW